ncbi:MAG: DJ-1/PfpI family protein [Tannerellaceae bacterium]|jgi:4-methyl-5(b-hydroxyethyl)-thiazole monophosphate biosynthesis|nr:DJ-1/PfpI family protein [Tannerellaceae bacterium]
MKTAFIFLADGFEGIEAVGVADVLRRADIDALFVSTGDEPCVKDSHNISVAADLTLADLASREADAIILPGGMPGSNNLNRNEALKKLIVEHYRKGKLTAAICAAPIVLGGLGLLKGRSATCYPGFESQLEGATVSGAPAVTDGNIITGKSPGSVFDFGLALVEYLEGREAADKVAADLCLPA